MRVRACAVAVLLMAVLAGCGGSTKTTTVTVTAKPVTTRATGTTPAGSTTSATVTTPPLATRAGQVNKYPVTLSIVSLARAGATVELTIELTTTSSQDVQIADTFDDEIDERVTAPGATELSSAETLDGINLIDTIDAKKYPVARDSYNQCLCDTGLDNTFMTPVASNTNPNGSDNPRGRALNRRVEIHYIG
jgi:hypothetical protein